MDLQTLAVLDTAFLHLRNVDGEHLTEAGTPVGITLYGPGTKTYAQALARKQARTVERMRRQGKPTSPAVDAEEEADDNATFLADVTVNFQQIEYLGLRGYELYKAVYASQPLGFIAEQTTRFLSSWANFKPASATT